MHSVTESDGVPSDPYDVLCHMAALIIEGRTPVHILKGVADIGVSNSETGSKSMKPYQEGPHCPNFVKFYNKESSNAHKCSENVLCLRFSKLKQHLLHLYEKSVPICVEVSLGPDCLCGELRSQSTLVSVAPSKRDIVLEQWTISINRKRAHESSQMSVMNLYQAVRSLLHFSQLTAWYMRYNGTKPAHIIYRVGVPGDSTFTGDDNFSKHDFPVTDINKVISIKMSVHTAQRMENIPSVYCPQHSCGSLDSAVGCLDGIHQESQEFSCGNKEIKYLGHGITSKLNIDEKSEIADSLPLKFQGVRKKIYKPQERKSKSRIAYFGSSPTFNPCRTELCEKLEYLDTIAVKKKATKTSTKGAVTVFNDNKTFPCDSLKSRNFSSESPVVNLARVKTSQFTGKLKSHNDFDAFESYSYNFLDKKYVEPTVSLMNTFKSLGKSEEECKHLWKRDKLEESFLERISHQKYEEQTLRSLKKLDIVDDRMQISCGISGKHHCRCEYEEEVDSFSVEKPRRRRSLGKGKLCETLDNAEADKILHGKFKEVDCGAEVEETGGKCGQLQKNCTVTLKTSKRSIQCESSKWITPDLPVKKKSFKSILKNDVECLDKAASAVAEADGAAEVPQESLPLLEVKTDLPSDLDTNSSTSNDEDWKVKSYIADEAEKKTPVAEEEHEGVEGKQPPQKSPSKQKEEEDKTKNVTKTDTAESGANCSDDEWETTSNPFLAAILRSAKKVKPETHQPDSEGTHCTCDNSLINLYSSDLDKKDNLKNIKKPNRDYPVDKKINENRLKMSEKSKSTDKKNNAKDEVHEESVNLSKTLVKPREASKEVNRYRHRVNLDLRLDQKKASAVRNLSDFDVCEGPSEFISKSLHRLRSFFDKRDFDHEVDGNPESDSRIDSDVDENGNSTSNGTRTIPVPSAQEKLKFRRSLDSAAQLVFHRCSGLPLTSSPAPVRRNNNSFTFDSSLNSVSAIKSALFDSANSVSSDDENESEESLRSPASPGAWSIGSKSINYHSLSPLPLLGTFEESVLNGRLEPVSTVQGFTAELGASGSFCPRHLYLPVTAFFYTLGDNDKVSAPYLGHINLGKKGYNVPRSGTIQVTLFNPLRTVVKMFVVVYDLHDMPPNSHTFLRQRTLYVPAEQKESTYLDKKDAPFEQEDYHKYLRYLIHLRFISGKTGRIYLHTDIRMVIFRKADEDTATALGKQIDGETFELRSHTHGPTNPKFSPRK